MTQFLQLSHLKNFVVRFIQIIIVFPMAILINFYMPQVSFIKYEMTFLLCVIIATTISIIVTKYSRKLIVLMFFTLLGMTAFNSSNYSMDSLYNDYNAALVSMTNNPNNVSYFKPVKGTYFQERRVKNAMQPTHPQVREFAVENSTRYFNGEYYSKYNKLARYFSLFKHIRINWKYVNDPRNSDYYSAPIESIDLLAGDCDDYAILMASSVMAVGGEARVIISESHMYTEVKVGTVDDLDKVSEAVRTLFPDEVSGGKIHYHETNGELWMNFDYTANYPGGPFLEPELYSVVTFD